jgi:hypothetical protein
MTSRRVPVHRPSGGANRAARRAAGHPGTGGAGAAASGPGFISPFQPPPGQADFGGDLAAINEGLWMVVTVDGDAWRAKQGQTARLDQLVEAMETEGGEQVRAMLAYLGEHMHPEDLMRVISRLMDPDDPMDMGYFNRLWRAVVTVGTARPFPQLRASSVPSLITGGRCERDSLWQGYLRR